MSNTMLFSDFVEIHPKVPLTKGFEYPFIEMEIVTPGRRYVSPRSKRQYKGGGGKFQAGDTLFARITPCLENGKIAQFLGKKGEIGFGSTEFFVFRNKEGISDPRYVFYLAYSDIIRKPAEKSMSGASGRQRADLASIKDLEIPAPPLPIQRKIASILSAYDDLIENNTRRIKILEEMAQTIYREWFVHFRFPGHEKVKMVESEMGLIPEGWEVKTLGDIVENVRTKLKPGLHLEPLPYVPIDCIPRRSLALTTTKPASEAKSSLIGFKKKDILFGAMRPYFHKVVLAPFDGITRQTCFVLGSKEPENYPFNLFTIFEDSTVEYASNHSTGSTIPYASWDGGLSEMPIVKPPKSLSKSFGAIVKSMLDLIEEMIARNRILRQTRDLLLPKFISGEIDVSELEVDISEV